MIHRRVRPPAPRHRSRRDRRSGSTRSTPSSTPGARPGPASCCRSLTERARERQVGTPAEVNTPYVNTIPTDEQPWFPGDEQLEQRIRAFIRWNAAVMVVKANKHADGIGGHLSTFASSAALYEVGFNHFFRGKDDGLPGDHVYFQGHAAPGIYARAFLEGRLDESQLDNFRRETRRRRACRRYPHPWLMPDFWEYPTVSMGLGPINSIYQARFNRYLHNRHIDDTSESRVWCFVGDGECDEPETLGSISLAGREQLDNLTWVVNCNLQRLDGPVRGNGKIIQELEAIFRGAGLERHQGHLGLELGRAARPRRRRRAAPQDEHHRRRRVPALRRRVRAPTSASTSSGPTRACASWSSTSPTTSCATCPAAATTTRSSTPPTRPPPSSAARPTVILAKTVKGWTLGSDVEGRNATHQIKKMTADQLKDLRDRLHLHDEIPDVGLRRRRPALLPARRPTRPSTST